jgi:hypothetical protein
MSKAYQVLVTARTSEYVPEAESEEQAKAIVRAKLGLPQFDDVDLEVTELSDNSTGAS